jgi:hypothetical protein
MVRALALDVHPLAIDHRLGVDLASEEREFLVDVALIARHDLQPALVLEHAHDDWLHALAAAEELRLLWISVGARRFATFLEEYVERCAPRAEAEHGSHVGTAEKLGAIDDLLRRVHARLGGNGARTAPLRGCSLQRTVDRWAAPASSRRSARSSAAPMKARSRS